MEMRAQVSLQFDDEELFDGFVKEMKKQHLLNSLIVKMLAVYYRNDEVRTVVDNSSMFGILNESADSVTEESDKKVYGDKESSESRFKEIHDALLYQSFCLSELEDAVENGMEDVMEQMQERGVKVKETDTGTKVPYIDWVGVKETKEKAEKVRGSKPKDLVSVLLQCVESIADSTGNTKVHELLKEYKENSAGLGSGTEDSVVAEDEAEPVEEFVEELVQEPIEESVEELVQEPIEETGIVEVSSGEDATSALDELFGSLFA